MYVFTVQPIADRVANNFEEISKKIQLSTRRHRILIGLIITTKVLHGNNHKSNGQNSGSLKSFRNNVKSLCHPICNHLYVSMVVCIHNMFSLPLHVLVQGCDDA